VARWDGAPYDPLMHHPLVTILAHSATILGGMVGAFTAIFAGLWAARRAKPPHRARRSQRRSSAPAT
jgi:hypothetical protein